MYIETPTLADEEAAQRHFEIFLPADIEKGAASLDREAEEAERAGDIQRAAAKRKGAAAARVYAADLKSIWRHTSWVNLSEEAQVFAQAAQLSGILIDSRLGGRDTTQDAIRWRLVKNGAFVHIADEGQVAFFAITGYYEPR